MTDPAEPSGVKSSLRTLEILEYLGACGERRSIAAMSRDLGIPKSSLHGLLHTMAARGWLETDVAGTGYGIGLRALLAGAAYVETDDLVPLANGALDLVSERSGETVHLADSTAATSSISPSESRGTRCDSSPPSVAGSRPTRRARQGPARPVRR